MNILFWSGGKDSYLAWHFFRESHPEANMKLLTTYDESNETVPHQEIPIAEIKEQAEQLNLELLTVRLPGECSNEIYLERVGKALENVEEPIENLVFGDWRLEDIRKWREEVFGEMGYSCIFPIWKKDLHELLPILFLGPVQVKISAVNKAFQSVLKVGEPYNQKLLTQLYRLNNIDPVGEKGEFHTKVIIKTPNQPARR